MPTGRDDYTGSVIVTGSVTITAPVQITGTVTITGAVTITSGNIYISTLNANNIIIDLLTNAAYTENRRTVSNYGTSVDADRGLAIARAKFFPRQMRGFIDTIEVYLKNTTGNNRTGYWYLCPYPGGPQILTGSFAISSAWSSYDWRSISIGSFWNCDGLAIMVKANDIDIYVGLTTTGDPDEWYCTYATAPYSAWTKDTGRLWIRVNMAGQNIGDVCISGTVNNIPLPNLASAVQPSGDVEVAAGNSYTFLDAVGAGTLTWLVLRMFGASLLNYSFAMTRLHIFVDEVDIFGDGKTLGDYCVLLPSLMAAGGAGTQGYSHLPWGYHKIAPTTQDDGVFFIAYPIQFTKHLKITVENIGALATTYEFGCHYNLLK